MWKEFVVQKTLGEKWLVLWTRDFHPCWIHSSGVCIDPCQYPQTPERYARMGKDRIVWICASGRFDIHERLPLVVHARNRCSGKV